MRDQPRQKKIAQEQEKAVNVREEQKERGATSPMASYSREIIQMRKGRLGLING